MARNQPSSNVNTKSFMNVRTRREKVRFISGDTECAAWHYPGTNGACVIMAGGGSVAKEPGTDLSAKRFHEAGFAVLAFDYRRLGESGGQPRQVVRIREQLTDWQAAIAFAAGLPEVDPARLAIWGFSLSAYGSRGGVEPLAGLAVRLRAPGAEVRVCAPADCAERLAGVNVPLVPAWPVRPTCPGSSTPSPQRPRDVMRWWRAA